MDTLFLLQFACFLFMILNAGILIVSRIHVRWVNKRYERSRKLIIAAMLGLAGHYILQMAFGLRASSDNLGAIVNILITLLHTHLIGYLQRHCPSCPFQTDEPCVWRAICCHCRNIIAWLLQQAKHTHRVVALSHARFLHRKYGLLRNKKFHRDEATQEDA